MFVERSCTKAVMDVSWIVYYCFCPSCTDRNNQPKTFSSSTWSHRHMCHHHCEQLGHSSQHSYLCNLQALEGWHVGLLYLMENTQEKLPLMKLSLLVFACSILWNVVSVAPFTLYTLFHATFLVEHTLFYAAFLLLTYLILWNIPSSIYPWFPSLTCPCLHNFSSLT